ncbi:DNA repair protein RecO [Desulfotomaculum copahuensis]|uniref:DNA repair protein RecO n=1 Tax=Desulfotomaculum copahuensis TaxID=1838280 RepID=A0A1B7LHN2_9FIRM|nr:DNA repair protein RecO [Desulfotomaculum copahuensis]OAT85799.1 DNA repair protein RecO [Desulfotomaculum copahuensis]
MRLYKVSALVLKAVNIREADLILTLFSRERGKIRVLAYGACKPGSRKRGAVQPFSCANFLLCRGRDLDTVSQADLQEMFPALRERLDLLGYASYLAELVDAFTAEGEAAPAVFELLQQSFGLLGHIQTALLTRAFEIKLLTLLGYRPCLESCVSCGGALGGEPVYHAGAGGMLCPRCAALQHGGLRCRRGTVATLRLLLRWDLRRLNRLRPDDAIRREMRQILRRHMEYHLERRMKSLQFLRLIGEDY